MKVTKETIESYKIRLDDHEWADIAIDKGVKSGRIQIASGWGSWERYWGSCGQPFIEFLIGLNINYAAGKFGCDRHFDLDSTVKLWKKEIIDARKDNNVDSEYARVLFNEVLRFESEQPNKSFAEHMMWTSELLEFFNHSPDFHTTISPAFLNFWKRIWIPFTEHLQSEINEKIKAA